jgi:DNA polymerase-3 subunit delta
MDSLAFLEQVSETDPKPFYVLPGDEEFLKRQVLAALQDLILGDEDRAFGLSTHPGDRATFGAIRDELDTLPFLSSRRLVIVENADPFVTRYRSELEKFVAEPPRTGVLVLEVKSWPSNTRLAKLTPTGATIICKAPPAFKLADWCVQWTAKRHSKQLTGAAAHLLVDLVGPEMGLLDQELTKLAVYAGKSNRIDAADVDKLVGSSREENTWKIFDAIGAGQAREALGILNRLFDQGEEPLRLLGAFSMQLRRLAQAARLNQQEQSLTAALDKAGVPPFAQRGCEQQLRHLGWRRADQLYDWLLDVDQGLKGGSQLPARTLLERLVVQLARKP